MQATPPETTSNGLVFHRFDPWRWLATGLIGGLWALACPIGALAEVDDLALTADQRGVIRAIAGDDAREIDCDLLVGLLNEGRLGGVPEEREAILAGLSACGDRRSVGVLFAHFLEAEGADRRALEEALVAALALDAPPRDWGAWWDTWSGVSEAAWDSAIIDRLRSDVRTLEAARDEAEAELLAAYRRVLSLTPEGERSGLIATLVASPSDRLALVGLELAIQTLLNAGDLTGGVIDAATNQLSGRPRLLFTAARLLEQVAPERVAERAEGLLVDGCDEALASVVLRSVARSPDAPLDPRLVVAWLERGSARLGAGDRTLFNAACLAGARPGAAHPPDARDQMVSVLEAIEDAQMTEAAAALLASLGERDRVLALLRRGPDGAAIGAARALSGDAEALPTLVEVAQERAPLQPVAFDAIRATSPDRDGLELVLGLCGPAPNPTQASAIASFAGLLQADDLAAALTPARSDAVVVALLGGLVETVGVNGPPDPRIGALMLALGEAQLGLDRPGPAMESARRAFVQREDLVARRAHLLVTAALRSGDIAAAEAESGGSGVPARVWLDETPALEGEARSRAVASIERLYAGQLTEAEAAELAALNTPAGDPPEGESEAAPES